MTNKANVLALTCFELAVLVGLCAPCQSEEVGIDLFSEGGAIQAAVKGWQMRSTYASR